MSRRPRPEPSSDTHISRNHWQPETQSASPRHSASSLSGAPRMPQRRSQLDSHAIGRVLDATAGTRARGQTLLSLKPLLSKGMLTRRYSCNSLKLVRGGTADSLSKTKNQHVQTRFQKTIATPTNNETASRNSCIAYDQLLHETLAHPPKLLSEASEASARCSLEDRRYPVRGHGVPLRAGPPELGANPVGVRLEARDLPPDPRSKLNQRALHWLRGRAPGLCEQKLK